MKRLIYMIGCLLLATASYAQTPSWAKKATQAVFTLKTFDANGQLLASSNGFFVSEKGEAVSSFAPFKGAQRAIVIDAQDKEWEIESIIGVNDMYDVAKFQVAIKKPAALPISTAAADNGATVWLLPYSVKKVPVCPKGTVEKTEQFQGSHTYYTLNMAYKDQNTNCPILNENGEVIGILQPAAGDAGDVSYAVSARFASELTMSGLSFNDPTLRSTSIPKAIPDEKEQALLALYVGSTAMDSLQYANFIDRFIAKFPNLSDGYIYRARLSSSKGQYAEADDDMKRAIKVADSKDDAHYQYAQLITQKLLLKTDDYAPWTFDLALQEAKEAYRCNPMPVYKQQQAEILYSQKKYDESFKLYQELTSGEMRTADLFYAAAQCKLQQEDKEAALAQMDSAVNMFTKPYLKTAAPYLLARAQMLNDAGKYRQAVSDYNEYEQLMKAQLAAGFYYMRQQAEVNGHLYQQALNDINKAIEMAPTEPLYHMEKASLQLRVGQTKEAEETARECIRLAPDDSDGYLFLGVAQCVNKQKAEGLKNLQKAKELGNGQAQGLIDKYSK